MVTVVRLLRRLVGAWAGLSCAGVPLLVAAAGATGLSMGSLWWVVATGSLACAAGRRPGPARAAAIVLAVVVGAGVVAVGVVPAWITFGDRFVTVLVGAAVLPWFGGRFWRQYRALERAGWERAEHLSHERRLVAEQARLRERARIAQDMHDLLGHDLSLIALSAGALKLSPGLPDEQREAAGDIRGRAATAVDRLGEIIGVLGEAGAVVSPSRVEDLVVSASGAGLPVTLDVEGEPGGLSPVAELAVRRVVQESLTNAAKHAPGATVTVRLRHTAGEVDVRVESGQVRNGAGAVPPGGGRGLIGLDERVRLAGGSMTYGPYEGGFAVVARIPHDPGASPARRASRTPHSPSVSRRTAGEAPYKPDAVRLEHRRARRRLGRIARAALWVPPAVLLLLGAVLRGWDLFLVHDAVLAPEDYARIQVGQSREEFAPLLPARQTPHRPTDDNPTDDNPTDDNPMDDNSASPSPRCEYYAMTADRFDDHSGDAYRLCFRAGRLVLKQVVTP